MDIVQTCSLSLTSFQSFSIRSPGILVSTDEPNGLLALLGCFMMVINWLQFSCMFLNFLIVIKDLWTIQLRVCTLLYYFDEKLFSVFLFLDIDWCHCKFVFKGCIMRLKNCLPYSSVPLRLDFDWSLMNKLMLHHVDEQTAYHVVDLLLHCDWALEASRNTVLDRHRSWEEFIIILNIVTSSP